MSELCCKKCDRKTCYFHPSKKKWREGLGEKGNSPITIKTFIERFGCASHSSLHPSKDLSKEDNICIGTLPNNVDYCCQICHCKEKCENIRTMKQQIRKDVLGDLLNLIDGKVTVGDFLIVLEKVRSLNKRGANNNDY